MAENKKFPCGCGTSFKTKYDRNRHRGSSRCALNGKRPNVCTICGKVINHKGNRQRHEKICKRKFQMVPNQNVIPDGTIPDNMLLEDSAEKSIMETLEDIKYFTSEINKYVEKLKNAYEVLAEKYESISGQKVASDVVEVVECSPLIDMNWSKCKSVKGRKRRKTADLNDPLNEAVQDVSSCQDDGVIESKLKPDVTRKNIPKKVLSSAGLPLEQDMHLQGMEEVLTENY